MLKRAIAHQADLFQPPAPSNGGDSAKGRRGVVAQKAQVRAARRAQARFAVRRAALNASAAGERAVKGGGKAAQYAHAQLGENRGKNRHCDVTPRLTRGNCRMGAGGAVMLRRGYRWR